MLNPVSGERLPVDPIQIVGRVAREKDRGLEIRQYLHERIRPRGAPRRHADELQTFREVAEE